MIRRKKIKVVLKLLSKAWGYAYADKRVIELDSRMDDKTMLDAASHEVIHCHFPWMMEQPVNACGEDIADVLWRLGFRRIEKGEE